MPLPQATRVFKDGATYAKNTATRAAMFLPSACATLHSGAKPLDELIEEIAKKKVEIQIKYQFYDQAWLSTNPPPYIVAIGRATHDLQMELIQMIDDRGEDKKRVIMLEVNQKLEKQKKIDNIPALEGRVAAVELVLNGRVGKAPATNISRGGIRDMLRVMQGRIDVLEKTPRNHPAKDTGDTTRCCRHCKDLRGVKADLEALIQRLWNPEEGALNLDTIQRFCSQAWNQLQEQHKKLKEYDGKFAKHDAMTTPTAPVQQPRETSCSCDPNAVQTLTTKVDGHDQRIAKIESQSPHLNALWDFFVSLKTEGLPQLANHIATMDAEFTRQRTKIAELEGQLKPESLKLLVQEAANAAVADVKAAHDGQVKDIKRTVEDQVKAAVAKEKATHGDEIKRIENGIKSQVEAAVADLVAKKDEQIQDLNAKNTQLHSEKDALEGKLEAKAQELKKEGEKIKAQEKEIEEQGKKIAAHDRLFDAIATEQTEQNDRLDRLEQRQAMGGGQNFAGPEQQQQPPQGNGPFTPSPSPPHQGSQDNQGTSGNPMGVKDASADGAQSEADLIDFDTGDDEMKEAPEHNAQPSQPQTQPAPIFGAQPAGQPQQMGGEQPFFGRGPASSPSDPTEPQPPAAAPTPSIFGNVGQASASDPKINWGANLGDINFADLNQPPAEPSAPENGMPPAGPDTFNPWAGGSVPSFFPQATGASGPDAPAPVAPMCASDAPPSTPSGFPSAPSQSNAFPGTAPAGGFDFNMPLPPVSAGPVASGTDFGAGFQNMTFPNGRIIDPGQQLNEHGRPMIEPRSIRRTPATQAPASSPVAAPAAQRGRNFNAYVEDAPDEEQDVHMDMGGQGAGQNTNPVSPAAPEASMGNQPAPVSAQPSTSGHMAGPNPSQQSVQPGVLNDKFSLDVFNKWKADVRANHTTFPQVSGTQLPNYEAQQRQNQVWRDNLNMMERMEGHTNKLVNDLHLRHARTKGCSKDEMSTLMSTWLKNVFLQAAVDTCDKDRKHLKDVCDALADKAKAWLSSEVARYQTINPATPEATTRNEPAAVPAQRSTSGAVTGANLHQSQPPIVQQGPGPRNTRFSLAFYDQWKRFVCGDNKDFTKFAGLNVSDWDKQNLNLTWKQNVNAKDSEPALTTRGLLEDLKLATDVSGYSRNDMEKLMRAWVDKVFHEAAKATSSMNMDALDTKKKQLLSDIKASLLTRHADVA